MDIPWPSLYIIAFVCAFAGGGLLVPVLRDVWFGIRIARTFETSGIPLTGSRLARYVSSIVWACDGNSWINIAGKSVRR